MTVQVNRVRIRSVFSSALLACSLISCGSGSSSNGSDPEVSTNSSAAVPSGVSNNSTGQVMTRSVGVITGFGSVFVNGVEFHTNSARFSTDDNPQSSEDALVVGMIITVSGSIDEDGENGDATEITYEEELQGFVESIDLAEELFVVLGQTVFIDELTNFKNITFDELKVDDLVEVSGLFDSDGNLIATMVKLEDDAAAPMLKMEGLIENLNAGEALFDLHEMTVDFSQAIFENGSIGDLAEGMQVRVKSRAEVIDGVFTAEFLIIELDASDDDEREGGPIVVDGIIDRFDSEIDFSVNGHPVSTAEETKFLSGTVDDLALNQRVRIKGKFDAEGVIIIDHITLQVRHFLGLEGEIEAVDMAAETISLMGLVFLVDSHTHFIDTGPGRIRYFSIADLMVGDTVELKGQETENDGEYLAVKIKRYSDRDKGDVKLSGQVDGVDIVRLQFELNGLLVRLTEITELEIQGGGHVSINDFFEALDDESVVKVIGQNEDGIIAAIKIKLLKSRSERNKDRKNNGGKDKDSEGEGEAEDADDEKGQGKNIGKGKEKDNDKDLDEDDEDDSKG